MSPTTQDSARCSRRPQAGFSLVELMVAIAIALFLIGGLVTVLQNIRSTSAMQTEQAQLQDSQRLALTMMAGVVESAGYFPNPLGNSATAAMPIAAGSAFAAAGTPVIIGTSNFNAQGDSLTVRYAAALGEDVFNCQGGKNTTVGPDDGWENTFSVNAANQLVCSVWRASAPQNPPPAAVPLVNGVQSMSVLYGVQTNGGATSTCTDTYMTATQVTAAVAWGNVCSAVVTLTFFDPTFPAASGKTVPPVRRVMALMQTAGVT
ncbi:MAG: PilW family protein [Steroidobacteraceae bacterium]